MRALLLLALLPLVPANSAEQQDFECPGKSVAEMRWCASRELGESDSDILWKKMPPKMMYQWKETTKKACFFAHKSSKDSKIYQQLIIDCIDELNRALLKEFRKLGVDYI